VAALKQFGGESLHVYGSTQLVHALLASNLVDELRLMIDPILLGRGKRIFHDGALTSLRLIDSQPTTTGGSSGDLLDRQGAPLA
jgi:dihydrofolate reductase